MGFAALYKRFRSSHFFIIVLSAFIIGWLALHFLDGFDPGFGALNMILSIEASVSMAIFMAIEDHISVMEAKTDEFERQQHAAMLTLLEGQKLMLREVLTKLVNDAERTDERGKEQ